MFRCFGRSMTVSCDANLSASIANEKPYVAAAFKPCALPNTMHTDGAKPASAVANTCDTMSSPSPMLDYAAIIPTIVAQRPLQFQTKDARIDQPSTPEAAAVGHADVMPQTPSARQVGCSQGLWSRASCMHAACRISQRLMLQVMMLVNIKPCVCMPLQVRRLLAEVMQHSTALLQGRHTRQPSYPRQLGSHQLLVSAAVVRGSLTAGCRPAYPACWKLYHISCRMVILYTALHRHLCTFERHSIRSLASRTAVTCISTDKLGIVRVTKG